MIRRTTRNIEAASQNIVDDIAAPSKQQRRSIADQHYSTIEAASQNIVDDIAAPSQLHCRNIADDIAETLYVAAHSRTSNPALTDANVAHRRTSQTDATPDH